MLSGSDFVFIIGAARGGTTWLQAMMASHPAICSTIDELKLFDFFTVPLEEGWNYLLRLQESTGGGRNGLTALWSESDFYGFLGEFVERVYRQVHELKPHATVILDKAPAYSYCVEHIDRIIPRAKFIHVIRDGRDVAVSLMAAAKGWGRMWAAQSVQDAATYWRTNTLAAKKAAQFQGRYIEVRYEDLLERGVATLRDVFEFSGVAAEPGQVNEIYQRHNFENMKQAGTGANDFELPKEFFRSGKAGDWRTNLSPEQRYAFHRVAGDLLCELGYAEVSWWCDSPIERVTVPLSLALSDPRRVKAGLGNLLRRGMKTLDRRRSRLHVGSPLANQHGERQ